MAGLCVYVAAAALVLSTAAAGRAAEPPPAPPEKADGAGAVKGPDITFVDPDEGEEGEGPPSPFERGDVLARRDAVPGFIELSSGRKVPGKICTTRGRRLKVFNLDRQAYEFVPVPALERIEAVVEWERIEREWRFKEAGNPEKVYSGREYPARKIAWRLTLRNGHVITGHILGQPLYVAREGEPERWILHDRQKGDVGTTLEALLYIRRVEFGLKAFTAAVKEMKAKEAGGAGEGQGPAPGGTKAAPGPARP
jgi:hypothetical protein